MRNEERVERLLVEASCMPRRMGRAELGTANAEWRRVFSAGVFGTTRRWVLDHYDWHTFSHGYHPSMGGRAARATMAAITPSSFFVLSGWDFDWFGFKCHGSIPMEELEALKVDLLLFEQSLEWTLAFTHEDQLFFAWSQIHDLSG